MVKHFKEMHFIDHLFTKCTGEIIIILTGVRTNQPAVTCSVLTLSLNTPSGIMRACSVAALIEDEGNVIMLNILLWVYDFSSDRQQSSSSGIIRTVSQETSGRDATRS